MSRKIAPLVVIYAFVAIGLSTAQQAPPNPTVATDQ